MTIRCQDEPLTFFEIYSQEFHFVDFPLARSYNILVGIERRSEIDLIRLRLMKVLYSRLKQRFCVRYSRSDKVEELSQIILLSKLVDGDIDEVKENISRWANDGDRIEAICRDIGDAKATENKHLGVIFRLPSDFNDEWWVSR
jgi:hypothetical protein